MNPTIKLICNKFVYNNSICMEDLLKIWTNKLEIEVQKLETDDSFFIITNNLENTLISIKKLNPDEKIPTDCRFFSFFIGNLIKSPKEKSIIRMVLNLNSFEVMVPKNCLYLTLNTDKFKLSNSTSAIKVSDLMSVALQDNQGQWITCVDNENKLYIGIVREGNLILELDKWVTRYSGVIQKKVEKITKSTNIISNKKQDSINLYKISMESLFNTLLKFHGLNIACYKFNEIYSEERIINILA